MTFSTMPEAFQTTIVLSDARKNVLAEAMRDARETQDKTELMPWASAIETAAEQRARKRAERLKWFVESL